MTYRDDSAPSVGAVELVLSCFPGIDGLGMGFEAEGYCVVQGPDIQWGRSIKGWHPARGRFDGIIGGPPCQAFSRLRHLVEHNGYAIAENLIPEFERVVLEAQPWWFVMENVSAAPLPVVPGFVIQSVVLNNRWLGEVQNRERRISFGTRDGRALDFGPELTVLEANDWQPAVMASGGRPTPVALGPGGRRLATTARNIGFKTDAYYRQAVRLQGFPDGFLDAAPFTVKGKIKLIGNAVPVPMARAIARAVRRALSAERAA